MNTNIKHQNVKKACLKANTWLIIAVTIGLIGITSCVPPVNGTTGQRLSKREVQLANTSYSKSKKYKKATQNTIESDENEDDNYSENTNKIPPPDTEYDNIQAFEKMLNNQKNKSNPDENNQSKSIPSLKEQMEQLQQKQEDTDESINYIKGDLLEIKSMLSDIAGNKIKPTAAGSAMRAVNNAATNQSVDKEDTQEHNIIESEEANDEYIHEESPKVEKKNDNIIQPDPKPQEKVIPKEEKIAPKQNKNFKIVKAASNKSTGKTNNVVAKSEPADKVPDTKITTSEASTSNNATADFSGIIGTIAKKDFAGAAKQINDKMKNTNNKDIIANCNYWLGECSFNQRDYAKSIEYYKLALNKQCDKKDVAQVRIAEAYLRVGKNNEAKVAYQTLLREYPKSSHSPKAKKMLQQL